MRSEIRDKTERLKRPDGHLKLPHVWRRPDYDVSEVMAMHEAASLSR